MSLIFCNENCDDRISATASPATVSDRIRDDDDDSGW